MSRLSLVVFALCLLVATAPGRAAEGFQIVVHRANPATTLTRDQVSKMFLKKIARWGDGQAVSPVDQRATSPVRARFSTAIHRKDASAVLAYWNQMIFSGRDVPPPERASDAAVIAFVRANPGAIGYVTAATAEVKVVDVVEN